MRTSTTLPPSTPARHRSRHRRQTAGRNARRTLLKSGSGGIRNGRIPPLPLSPWPAAVVRERLVCACPGSCRVARRPVSATVPRRTSWWPPRSAGARKRNSRMARPCASGTRTLQSMPVPRTRSLPMRRGRLAPRDGGGTAGGSDLVAAPCAIGARAVAGAAGAGSGHRTSGRIASHSETASTSASSWPRKKWPAPGTIRWAECGFPAARIAARRRGAAPGTAG